MENQVKSTAPKKQTGFKKYIFVVTPFLFAFLFFLSVGCMQPALAATPKPKYTPGDIALTLTHDGLQRTFVLHIPPAVDDAKKTALILAFHGISLNAKEMNRISHFSDQADQSGFLVAYPEGTGSAKSWNAGHCCGTAARDKVDDVGFVRELIAELVKSYPIDPKRIYATGFSNGAIFTYALACQLSDIIAAFAPVSATPAAEDLKACAPSRPVPILHFHGTADDPNPYNGGKTPAGVEFLSVAATMHYWADFNGCPDKPESAKSGNIQHSKLSPCKSSSELELYTIIGGKHAWPGGEAVNEKMGEPTKEISATPLIWEFFKSHPLP